MPSTKIKKSSIDDDYLNSRNNLIQLLTREDNELSALIQKKFLAFENGKHNINYDDGSGDFNIQIGHFYDTLTSEFVATEVGCVSIAINHSSGNVSFKFKTTVAVDDRFTDWDEEYTIGGTEHCVLPIGFTYIQFPNEPDPNSLFGGTWENVSDTVAGDFIRFEGGKAITFESGRQLDAMQRITGKGDENWAVASASGSTGVFSIAGPATSKRISPASASGVALTFDNANSTSPNPAKTDDDETRSVNRTVRKWKRIL